MAASEKTGETRRVGIKVRTGYNEKGAEIYANRNYSNFNINATQDIIFEFLTKLGQLQKYTVADKKVYDTYTLVTAF